MIICLASQIIRDKPEQPAAEISLVKLREIAVKYNSDFSKMFIVITLMKKF
jgi:hypothetical protein